MSRTATDIPFVRPRRGRGWQRGGVLHGRIQDPARHRGGTARRNPAALRIAEQAPATDRALRAGRTQRGRAGNLAVLADRTGVQPSAIVRFAKSFGFDGATQMQRLFRDGLLSGNATLGYSERSEE